MSKIPQLSIIRGPTRQLNPKLLHRLFENIAIGTAENNIALIFNDNGQTRQHTYSELNRISNKLARTIQQSIVTHNLPRNADGDYIVAVNMHPSDHLVIALLAIWKAGAAYMPLDHAFPGPRIEHFIREAKPVIIIYDEGVRLPHKVILNRLQWQFKRFPYSNTENVCVFKTALTFLDSVAEIWGPLINGLSVLVVSKALTKDPEKMITLLEEYQIERLVLVPSLLRSLLMYLELQKNKKALRTLKLWICSGEILTVSLAEQFFKYFPENEHQLCNFYGSTEIMGDVTYHVVTGLSQLRHQDKVPIGLPVDNTIIYLLDRDFRPVKAGDVGEIFVSGLNLAAGYVNGRDPEKFLDNPLAIDPPYAKLYRTGDFARIEKGIFLYEGRTDSQVDKAVVLCYKPGEINQSLLAFVTGHSLLSEHQIETTLKDKLISYMIPQVILVENIPLLVNGKIDKQALLKNYENNDDAKPEVEISYEGVTMNQMEAAKVLFETVAAVLNRAARSSITVNANFYEIGGNSLNTIYTIVKLSEKGYHINIGDFISAMDLGEILLRMTSDTKINTRPPSFSAYLLKPEYKEAVLNMVTTSFYQKAGVKKLKMLCYLCESDYKELVTTLWEPVLEKNLSFIVKSEIGKIVGVALNFDARDEPKVKIQSKLNVVFEFLETIEGPIRDMQLPPGRGTVLHSFMMATHSSLSPKENVAVMQFMEEEVQEIKEQINESEILAIQSDETTDFKPVSNGYGSKIVPQWKYL
ncbi:hypothetical protein NQ314_004860 [Rhamnusium bicolor]|uniref:Carrier domain-containing protein n=1 Tax=Rhamnusium bicolor TaxID=1586634 RepID=A0AAV8ZKE5_9CUCU|nr:hypothetical protein NQ314_004860 [Rhamnusium bicolor]